MAETFSTNFTTGEAATGVIGAEGFTGTGLTSLLTTATLNGNVTNPGDQIDATVTVAGALPITTTATYQGFSVPQGGGEPTYYFSLEPVGLNTPAAIAVTKGGTLPLLNVLQPIARAEAPDSEFIVCYASDTQILTGRGEVTVEDLQIGDLAVTSSGEQLPIRWIGQRTINCSRHPNPASVQPVRIAAGALCENKPERDLLVSPGHAICLDILGEVLIPASALINGTTITQEQIEEVTYWHVELASHDILIANGQPAESYLDMGNRAFFGENGVVDLSALPDAGPAKRTHADFCRPFHDSGAVVDAVRAQLRRRAKALGWTLEQTDTWAGVHLDVDGLRIEPKVRGLSACFEVPAGAQDVCLVSPTSVPRHVSDNPDNRALGLSLTGLRLDDGLNDAKQLALDDPRLDEGFHAVAPDHRWIAGRARLPTGLFAGLEGTAFLRVDLRAPALPRWVAPKAAVETSELQPEALRLVKAA